MVKRARLRETIEVLELLPVFSELFAGFASSATAPQDAAANKRQVISSKKVCLMVAIGFSIYMIFVIVIKYPE
jgi:hypothetical protein